MPYGSARDLPAFVEMEQQLKAMRLLGFILPKEDRLTLRELPAKLRHLSTTVDAFYDLLGPRNWVFHEDLNATDMATLTTTHHQDPEGAETAFIAWYQAEDHLAWMTRRLNGHEGLRARMHLLQLALDDYQSERFYAVVQVLLSVMDGFVNDLTPANRRGLHAREAEELAAWNSVVGHHLGLTSAHKTFTRSFKARNDEPVHELYRNGIVHGMLTNYDNVVVATKAWNRLFAIADWARAMENEQREATKAPDPTWRDLFSQLRNNAETKKALEAFAPVRLDAGDQGITSHPVYQATTDFLQAWQQRNYGKMSKAITNAVKGAAPVEVRDDYQGHTLEDFELLSLSHSAAAITTVTLRLQIDGAAHTPELRWVREGPDGRSAAPNQPGDWRLMWWGFPYMTRDADE